MNELYKEFTELRNTRYGVCCCAAEIEMILGGIIEKANKENAPLSFVAELLAEIEYVKQHKDLIDKELDAPDSKTWWDIQHGI